jgi:hypothetical protein
MPWRGPEVEGEFPTLGYTLGEWIEENCIIPDGPLMGQPYRLTDEMWNHLLWKYRLRPDAKQDDFADAFAFGGSMIVRPQKWGKDPFVGTIDICHALGPCLFAGWDASGEPVARPHWSPWVAVAATNDEQTDNTFRPIVKNLQDGPLADTPGLEADKTIVKRNGQDLIEPLTTTASGRLGSPFTKVSLTETGILTGLGPRGGLAFARTLKRNVGGMNGMWTAATNTWDPTEQSDAQLTFEAKDPHIYVDARLARVHVDLDNDAALLAEVRHQYGDSAKSAGGWVSERRIMADCRNKAFGESEVRRFYLSEITSGARAAVNPAVWDAAQRRGQLEPGEAISLGFDGSRARDATVLVACRLSDGRLFKIGAWVPGEIGGPVPRPEVHEAVAAAFEAYKVSFLFADPYLWQDSIDTWSGLWPNRVVVFPTNVEIRMDRALERFLTALRSGDLTHDGDELLSEHAKNAALAKGKRKPPREDGETGLAAEYYMKVVKKRDGCLIDAFVAAVLAYAARGQAVEDGALVKASEPWGFFT